MENDNMVDKYEECAMCHGLITKSMMVVTLNSGKKICEMCIMKAMADRHMGARS